MRRNFCCAAVLLAGYACSALHVTTADGHKLWYRWSKAPDPAGLAPLVVLHGGPQIPSDYLFNLEGISGGARSVLFFDQLGCGRSDRPEASDAYSVDKAVRDLQCVLETLEVTQYHLYGQSWGGLLAFLSVSAGSTPLSLTLSNAPASVALAEAEAGALAEACEEPVAVVKRLGSRATTRGARRKASRKRFMERHSYRGAGEAPQLAAAYAHAGNTWRGTAAIAGLEASAEAMARVACPTLVLRGEHDFVTSACVEAWRGLGDVSFEELPDCSHHALLEAPDEYLRVVGAFLAARDVDCA